MKKYYIALVILLILAGAIFSGRSPDTETFEIQHRDHLTEQGLIVNVDKTITDKNNGKYIKVKTILYELNGVGIIYESDDSSSAGHIKLYSSSCGLMEGDHPLAGGEFKSGSNDNIIWLFCSELADKQSLSVKIYNEIIDIPIPMEALRNNTIIKEFCYSKVHKVIAGIYATQLHCSNTGGYKVILEDDLYDGNKSNVSSVY